MNNNRSQISSSNFQFQYVELVLMVWNISFVLILLYSLPHAWTIRLIMSFLKRLILFLLAAGIVIWIFNFWRISNVEHHSELQPIKDYGADIRNFDRKKRIYKLCEEYKLGQYNYPNGTNALGIKEPPSAQYSYYFSFRDQRLNIAWCPVYKAGSTTWLHHMLALKGYSEEFLKNPPKQLSVFSREVLPEAEPNADFEASKKIVIVRHPFERLVSAYVDKLSNASINYEHGTKHFYEKYGRMIVQKFRNDQSIQQLEPTFEEFVRYLLKEQIGFADVHWLRAYMSCTPCRVKFDFVGKVETYESDQEYIIKSLGLDLEPLWAHRTNSNRRSSFIEGVSERSRYYFSQLKKSQVDQLFHKYYLDFVLFDYNYEQYLNFAKTD